MKALLPALGGRILMVVFIMGLSLYSIYAFDLENKKLVYNDNLNKKLDIEYVIDEKEITYVDTNALPLGETRIIKEGQDGVTAYYGDMVEVISTSKKEVVWRGTSDSERVKEINSYPIIKTFISRMTGYGPDCKGCRGTTATGHDATKSIYYEDPEYGKIRIVAADASRYRYGSVMRVMNYSDWEPFLVIMLDCGGMIDGNDLDLLFPSESLGSRILATDNNVTVDIIRVGY